MVVPTLNRGDFLADCLADLVAQTYSPLEILVVDQSTTRSTRVDALVARHADLIEYRRVDFRGLLPARNYGWQHASHEAVIYVDDDIRCRDDFVAQHVSALLEPGVGAVAGGIDESVRYVPGELRRTRGFQRWVASPVGAYGDFDCYDVDAVKGCNFSAWRSALEAVGGFDERLNVGAALYEDLELCLRLRAAGHRIRFSGKARLQHLAAASGGCRVPNPEEYVASLAHNRAMLIERHLRPIERPTALARLCWTVLAYTRFHRQPAIVLSALRGYRAGVADGRLPVSCTPRSW